MSQKHNSGEHIDDIVNRTACDKHDAVKGIACFYIYYDSRKGDIGPAVCDIRVKKAGFNGKIHPSSLSRSSKTNEPKTRR